MDRRIRGRPAGSRSRWSSWTATGLVSHWSTGARRLFGRSKEEAVGPPAVDLLPVSGRSPRDECHSRPTTGYDGLRPRAWTSSLDGGPRYPAAGRARLDRRRGADRRAGWTSCGGRTRWSAPARSGCWCWPPTPCADSRRTGTLATGTRVAVERIAPGFALHTEFPGADELARGCPRSCRA